MMKPCAAYLCVIALGLGGCSSFMSSKPEQPLAEPTAKTTASGQDQAASATEPELIDTTRQQAHRLAYWIGDSVNSWFGDKPFSEGGKVSNGRLRVHTRWQENKGFKGGASFRARLSLPNLKDKAYLFFGQDNKEELVSDQPEAFSRQQQLLAENRRQDQAGFVGLGIMLHDHVDFRAGFRGGIKPYVQARYGRQWMLSALNRAEFRETVFWRIKDGFGSTTAVNFEHLYSPSLSLKWQNAATVTKQTDGFSWSSSLGLFKAFGDHRLLSLEALAGGETGSEIDVGEYGLRMKWKQPVYREWLLAEFILGHFWPKEKVDSERDRSWAVGAGVEMRF